MAKFGLKALTIIDGAFEDENRSPASDVTMLDAPHDVKSSRRHRRGLATSGSLLWSLSSGEASPPRMAEEAMIKLRELGDMAPRGKSLPFTAAEEVLKFLLEMDFELEVAPPAKIHFCIHLHLVSHPISSSSSSSITVSSCPGSLRGWRSSMIFLWSCGEN